MDTYATMKRHEREIEQLREENKRIREQIERHADALQALMVGPALEAEKPKTAKRGRGKTILASD